MKTFLSLALGLFVLTSAVLAQPDPTPAVPSAAPESQLTKFDLDFPGGTPRDLVVAIEKATGKPLNAIIPDEHANTKLPALKMQGVDTLRLFDALLRATDKPVIVNGQIWGTTRFGFFYPPNGPYASDDTIWVFRVEGASLGLQQQVKESSVYLLTPYLEQGLTVDDITTAIQTSWRMLGDPLVPPALTFHKETKLLIAVGDHRFLATIGSVLNALRKPSPKPSPAPAPEPSPEKASKS